MKSTLIALAVSLATASCHAQTAPAIGLLELVPVENTKFEVSARPAYIFTDQKLLSPTVFSALQGRASNLTVVCCYEVKNLTPVALETMLANYALDDSSAAHFNGIMGVCLRGAQQ